MSLKQIQNTIKVLKENPSTYHTRARKALESVLGHGGMRNLAKDTKSLVEQQKGLMKSGHEMQPMMKQLGGMVKGFGGVEGIKNLMGTMGKMKDMNQKQ